MTHAEDDDFLQQLEARKNRSRHVTGVHVTRVRHKACLCGNGLPLCVSLRIIANEKSEFFRIGRIKASGNRGEAQHGPPHNKNQIGFEGFPLNLMACIVAGL